MTLVRGLIGSKKARCEGDCDLELFEYICERAGGTRGQDGGRGAVW